jgi:UPF0716 protein FxsA
VSSLRMALVLVFFAFPFLEIMILIKAGETIGFWPTVGLLIAAAALGFILIREQGLSMVGRMFGAMNEGKLPFESMLDGYTLIFAGFLLIFPGFLSDAMALLLLVPPIRHWMIRRALPGIAPAPPGSGPEAAHRERGNVVIEGTYERIEDDDETPKPDR